MTHYGELYSFLLSDTGGQILTAKYPANRRYCKGVYIPFGGLFDQAMYMELRFEVWLPCAN